MLLRMTCTFLMLRQSVGKFVIVKKYNKKGIIMIYLKKKTSEVPDWPNTNHWSNNKYFLFKISIMYQTESLKDRSIIQIIF